MGKRQTGRAIAAMALVAALAGCQGTMPFGLNFGGDRANDAPRAAQASGGTRLVERDVEAPEVFQRSAQGLWSGTPSFGGVWVAHPEAEAPERVIIRNADTGGFVIGSLFKREAENPGPPFQISSDAAAALNVTAGTPTTLNVTALRRESVTEETPAEAEVATAAAEDVTTSTLPPLEAAAAAIEAAETAASTAAPAAAPSTVSTASAGASRLPKPFIQLGLFAVEANAQATADRLRGAGVVPLVVQSQSAGKTFWRVLAGPANTVTDRNALLATARQLGFLDAYAVSD